MEGIPMGRQVTSDMAEGGDHVRFSGNVDSVSGFACRTDKPREIFTFLLHVTLREDGYGYGMIQAIGRETENIPFAGLDRAFLAMNGWMERNSPTEGTVRMRYFEGRRTNDAHEDAGNQFLEEPRQKRRGAAGIAETFLVRVICRQHTSWQGEVCWKNQRLCFRSVLELMQMMDAVLLGHKNVFDVDKTEELGK